MAEDYIPRPDAEFKEWLESFLEYVNVNFAALGLTIAENAELQAFGAAWLNAYQEQLDAETNLAAKTQSKVTAKSNLEPFVRQLVKAIQANRAVTNEQRAALQITIPDTIRTATPTPATRPMARIDNSQRLRHIHHFFDESTPSSKKKPDGVRGCEIWIKIGGPTPSGVEGFERETEDTRTPHTIDFDAADAGKLVHYIYRWVNTRGEFGPWSETVSATISG